MTSHAESAVPSTLAMGTIARNTIIGTSDPADICKGFALFPVGTIRAGIESSDKAKTLLDLTPKILLWRLNFSVMYELFVGMCGPAYAIRFDVPSLEWDNTSDGQQQVTMGLENDDIQAGFFVGFTISFPISFSVQESVAVHWFTPWKRRWENKFKATFALTFDLIGIIITIIEKILEEGDVLKPVDDPAFRLDSLKGTWGLFDEQRDGLVKNEGAVSLNPTFNVPIDIVPMIPGLSEIDKGLKALLGYLRAGPAIGISLPTGIAIKNILVDSGKYPTEGV